jgi:hypothetical protein
MGLRMASPPCGHSLRPYVPFYEEPLQHFWLRSRQIAQCRWFQTIDTALKDKEENDRTACCTWALTPEADLLLYDCWAERIAVPYQMSALDALYIGQCRWLAESVAMVPLAPWQGTIMFQAVEDAASGILPNGVRAPIFASVGGILKHLRDDLAPPARVRRAFAFDECRDRVLVQVKVIQAPTITALGFVWNAHLTRNQQPTTRIFRVDLIAWKQIRIARQERLQDVFAVVGRFHQIGQAAGIVLKEENLGIGHAPPREKEERRTRAAPPGPAKAALIR